MTEKKLVAVTDKNGVQTRRWKRDFGDNNAERLKTFMTPDKAMSRDQRNSDYLGNLPPERHAQAHKAAVEENKKGKYPWKHLSLEKQNELIRLEAEALPPRNSADIPNFALEALTEGMESSGWKSDPNSSSPVFRCESYDVPGFGKLTPTIRSHFGEDGKMTSEEYDSATDGNGYRRFILAPKESDQLTFEDEDGKAVVVSGDFESVDTFGRTLINSSMGMTFSRYGDRTVVEKIESEHSETLVESAYVLNHYREDFIEDMSQLRFDWG